MLRTSRISPLGFTPPTRGAALNFPAVRPRSRVGAPRKMRVGGMTPHTHLPARVWGAERGGHSEVVPQGRTPSAGSTRSTPVVIRSRRPRPTPMRFGPQGPTPDGTDAPGLRHWREDRTGLAVGGSRPLTGPIRTGPHNRARYVDGFIREFVRLSLCGFWTAKGCRRRHPDAPVSSHPKRMQAHRRAEPNPELCARADNLPPNRQLLLKE